MNQELSVEYQADEIKLLYAKRIMARKKMPPLRRHADFAVAG